MVTLEEGQRRSKEIGCVCFHEISVRESIEQVWSVFRDVCRFWHVHSKCPKLKRSSSDIHSEQIVSPDSTRFICTSKLTAANGTAPPNGTQNTVSPVMMLGRRWTEVELEEEEEAAEEGKASEPGCSESLPPFRGRASTDGHLLSRPRRWRYPPPAPSSQQQYQHAGSSRADRRMSISMRGNNASC